MRILGIDPGLRHTGWAILTHTDTSYTLENYGCITPDENLPLAERLVYLKKELTYIIITYLPQVISLETIFLRHNPHSVLLLAYARAMVILVSGQHNISIVEFAPTSIKKNLTGRGNATKEDMVNMVSMLFGVDVVDHVADAIALALCASTKISINK